MDDPTRPPEADGAARPDVTEFWDRAVGEAENAAAAYRDAGWDAMALHPGRTTPVPAMGGDGTDDYGLSALVPPEEFEAVAAVEARAAFEDADVRRVGRGETVFVVAAFLAPAAGEAVVVPASYRRSEAASMLDRAASTGEMRVLVRSPVPEDELVVFRHGDPESWAPGGESE